MKQIVFLAIIIKCFFLCSCSNVDEVVDYSVEYAEFNDSTLECISEEVVPNLKIHEGYVSQQAETIRVLRNGVTVAIVKLSAPVIVAQADEKETWGYFQFPIIYKEDNKLIIDWEMREDSYSGYGIDSHGRMMSVDNGKTWTPLDENYYRKERYGIELNNGNLLQVKDVSATSIDNYLVFPQPVNSETINGYDFYLEKEVPEELQGVYLTIWDNNKDSIVHASLDDPGYLRYSIDGMMPIVWWGDIKQLKDGSLVAGVYPTFYQDMEGNILNTTTSFYKSRDMGRHWEIVGVIPHQKDNGISRLFDASDGFCEPTFEILKDGSYLCVMRTGWTTPMVRSFSSDGGQHWTEPEPFTSNGVLPNLLLLDNGVLVLASGRPGIQLRFCLDGKGKKWTEPIEMMPYQDEDGQYDIWGCTCGYPDIIKIDKNTFYMTYSDFLTKNIKGESRKSIVFRRIEVIKQP